MAKFNIPSFAIPPLFTYESMFKGISEWLNTTKNVSQDWDGNHRGFLNVPFVYNWTLLIFIAVTYLKCNIVLHGMKYQYPLTLLGGWLLPLYKLLSDALPNKEKYSVPFVDDESLFSGLYDYKVQVCMTLFTVPAVCNPHCALILDVCFVGICFWHLLYLYRNNIREYAIILCSFFVLYKEKHLLSSGVSWLQFYYLLALIYVVMKVTLPKKINLDVVLFYYCVILYIVYMTFVSVRQHGIVPPKTLQEYFSLSWMGQLMTNLTKSGSEFEWMPVHMERAMIYTEFY